MLFNLFRKEILVPFSYFVVSIWNGSELFHNSLCYYFNFLVLFYIYWNSTVALTLFLISQLLYISFKFYQCLMHSLQKLINIYWNEYTIIMKFLHIFSETNTDKSRINIGLLFSNLEILKQCTPGFLKSISFASVFAYGAVYNYVDSERISKK